MFSPAYKQLTDNCLTKVLTRLSIYYFNPKEFYFDLLASDKCRFLIINHNPSSNYRRRKQLAKEITLYLMNNNVYKHNLLQAIKKVNKADINSKIKQCG